VDRRPGRSRSRRPASAARRRASRPKDPASAPGASARAGRGPIPPPAYSTRPSELPRSFESSEPSVPRPDAAGISASISDEEEVFAVRQEAGPAPADLAHVAVDPLRPVSAHRRWRRPTWSESVASPSIRIWPPEPHERSAPDAGTDDDRCATAQGHPPDLLVGDERHFASVR
jgi:hypothetical protein